jgi:gas vesicle protein
MPYVDDPDLDQPEPGQPEQEAFPEEAEGATGLLGFVGGLVLGALIGAGIALLVAPERGRTLRQKLARRIRSAGHELRDDLDDLKDVAARRLARRRRRLRRRLGREVS